MWSTAPFEDTSWTSTFLLNSSVCYSGYMFNVEHVETSELKYNMKTLWSTQGCGLVINEVGANIGAQGSNSKRDKEY